MPLFSLSIENTKRTSLIWFNVKFIHVSGAAIYLTIVVCSSIKEPTPNSHEDTAKLLDTNTEDEHEM